jgi:hypothetical protein
VGFPRRGNSGILSTADHYGSRSLTVSYTVNLAGIRQRSSIGILTHLLNKEITISGANPTRRTPSLAPVSTRGQHRDLLDTGGNSHPGTSLSFPHPPNPLYYFTHPTNPLYLLTHTGINPPPDIPNWYGSHTLTGMNTLPWY